jgi:hypothetical protein
MDYKNFIFYNKNFVEIVPKGGQSDGTMVVRDYLDGKIIACFPDINSVSKVAGGGSVLNVV